MEDNVTVIQGDRDAAAEASMAIEYVRLDMREGRHDNSALVQAFARHRIDSIARLSPAPEGVDAREAFQARVDDWLLACFGADIARDPVERNHRFLEESLELVQACGCTASEAHQLVDYTFGRPVGERGQEVGGVMNTLAALCLAYDMDMAAEGDREIERCWIKIDRIRQKQRNKPKHSPLPAALSRPPAEQVRMREALVDARRELWHCAQQLAAHGRPGAQGDSVDRALAAADAALTPPPKGQNDG